MWVAIQQYRPMRQITFRAYLPSQGVLFKVKVMTLSRRESLGRLLIMPQDPCRSQSTIFDSKTKCVHHGLLLVHTMDIHTLRYLRRLFSQCNSIGITIMPLLRATSPRFQVVLCNRLHHRRVRTHTN